MNNINAQIAEIVAEYTDSPQVDFSMANSFEDLGIDSLSLVEIIFDIEEQFDIKIPAEAELQALGLPISTFTDVVAIVQHLVEKK